MSKKIRQMDISEACEKLQQGTININDLSKPLGDSCLIEFYENQHPISGIASMLNITRQRVYDSIKRVYESRAVELQKKGINAYELYIKFNAKCDWIQKKAKEKEDYNLFIKTERLRLDYLFRMGFISPDNTQAMQGMQVIIEGVEEKKKHEEAVLEAIKNLTPSQRMELVIDRNHPKLKDPYNTGKKDITPI